MTYLTSTNGDLNKFEEIKRFSRRLCRRNLKADIENFNNNSVQNVTDMNTMLYSRAFKEVTSFAICITAKVLSN